jgi:hypothetical protein
MAYTEHARELRRCRAMRKDGQPCANYAAWDDPFGRCGSHNGRVARPHLRERTAYPPCTCLAYCFPHRPGSGLCCWPEPPRFRLKMRPGTHARGRKELKPYTRGRPVQFGLNWL